MYRQSLTYEEFYLEAKERFQIPLNNKGGACPISATDILKMDFPHNPFLLENVCST